MLAGDQVVRLPLDQRLRVRNQVAPWVRMYQLPDQTWVVEISENTSCVENCGT